MMSADRKPTDPATGQAARTVMVLGATGTIGRATVAALAEAGHRPVPVVRAPAPDLPDDDQRVVDVTDAAAVARDLFAGAPVDAIVSCLASRTGVPADAWAVDHKAHCDVLQAAERSGVGQMVLLSAICVQKPVLGFQQAKLAFERALIDSSLTYSIVRPTAFFKSLSGQIERVRQGKPFLVFGDGQRTACKPISDGDLGAFLAGCLDDPARFNRILPIGGPGPAITPLEQATRLSELTGQPLRIRKVPVALLDTIIGILRLGGTVSTRLRDKAELARIGRYYATESMLVLDPETGRYDADATPSTGTETLFDFYDRIITQGLTVDRGDHAVF